MSIVRTRGAGGNKGAAITLLLAEGGHKRKEIAETVGCTVARVGEVVRFLKSQAEPHNAAVIDGKLDGVDLVPGVAAAHAAKPKHASKKAIAAALAAGEASVLPDAAAVIIALTAGSTETAALIDSFVERVEQPNFSEPVGFRTGTCEHERKRKAKKGSCKVCLPVAA
jgi:hypothetical protein